MSSPLQKISITLAAGIFTLVTGMPAYADDTEIFLGQNGTSPTAPNVLFIIDTSGSMGNAPSTGGSLSKLQIVKDVFNKLIDNTTGINAALMRFDNHNGNNKGGYFLSPMLSINSTTRTTLKTQVNGLTAHGNTPLAETMYEAAQFYRGDSVVFGASTTPGTNASGVLDPNDSTKYKSPMTSECQKNYTVLLTDGLPTHDDDADTAITTLIGGGTSTPTTSYAIDKSCDFTTGDDCLEELTQYLYENDQVPDTAVKGKQNVTTYTIGFDTTASASLLTTAAEAAGGKFYPADSSSKLTDALNNILKSITDVNNTFMAPSIALNSFDGLTHHNQLYYAQYQPAFSAKWDGNIKSYELYNNTDPNAACSTTLKDADGNDALEAAAKCEDRYKVKKTARSFWSTNADGNNVPQGGAAGKLPAIPDNRKVYTYVGNTAPSSASPIDLTASGNALKETNTSISKTMLGDAAMTDTDRTNLLKWARGVDVDDANGNNVTTDARKNMGDPLHSQPVIVTYKTTDAKNAEMVLFVGTNEGYLHAINANLVNDSNKDSGNELFSFIPKELLPNLKTFKANSSSVAHPYGLDGGITAWVNDKNGNGTIDSSDNDSVYLYVGMRRGGKNYYALDVTDPTSPKLMWVIHGGTDANFTELGQTWSKPTLATIMVGSTKTKVLVFAGGYDVNQDATTTHTVDSMGRALYIVNAKTGERIWWAGPAGSSADLALDALTNSIPSDVRVVDTDLDGLDDRIYVGDTAAQLFRFDIADNGTVTGGVVAALGGATASDNRRFFYPPDVALTRAPGQSPYISINIGSGYRAHPLNDIIQDRFYSLRDYDIFAAPATYTPLTESNLLDVTTLATLSSTNYSDLYTKKSGWYISLGSTEKVLAPSITFNRRIIFTTYLPPSTSSVTCSQGGSGTGRVYFIDLFDGTPVVRSPAADPLITDPASLSTGDRFVKLQAPGIPAAPVVAFNPKPTPCVGMQCYPDSLSVTIDKTYWEQTQ